MFQNTSVVNHSDFVFNVPFVVFLRTHSQGRTGRRRAKGGGSRFGQCARTRRMGGHAVQTGPRYGTLAVTDDETKSIATRKTLKTINALFLPIQIRQYCLHLHFDSFLFQHSLYSLLRRDPHPNTYRARFGDAAAIRHDHAFAGRARVGAFGIHTRVRAGTAGQRCSE